MAKVKVKFVPFTPAGSCLMHLARDTERKAIAALLAESPYTTWEAAKARGYEVARMHFTPPTNTGGAE